MTRAEYLEFVQEGLAFPPTGVGSPDPGRILYDSEEIVERLRLAHIGYCNEVARILGMGQHVQYAVSSTLFGKPGLVLVPEMTDPIADPEASSQN